MEGIEELRKILEQPLEVDNGHLLRTQLATRGAWQAPVSLAYRKAEKQLAEMRGKLFDPTLGSEDKRRNALEYATREYQEAVDTLKDLSQILSNHISLGQSMLRSIEAEIKGGV